MRPEAGSSNDAGEAPHGDATVRDQNAGPGCMPAVIAGTVLMGIIGFITCGVSTWVLYQKRADLVALTLSQTYIPAVEQSRLEPEDKQAVLEQLKAFEEKLERGEVENWQAAAVMQRLVRLPVLEWGDLQAVEERLKRDPGDHREALQEFSRLRRAVEIDQATMIDLEDVLEPVLAGDGTSMSRRTLVDPISVKAALDVAERAKLVADRSRVPDQFFDDVRIAPIVRRQMDAGMTEGSY